MKAKLFLFAFIAALGGLLFVTAALFFISAVWTGAAKSYTGFIIARLIGGIGVGGASVMAPMYISEISPPRIRGRLVSTAQLAIVTGIVVAFFSNFLLIRLGDNSWRYMFWAECVPAAAYFFMLFFVCPSPRWLVKNGKDDRAASILGKVGGQEYARTVVAEIKDTLVNEIEQVNFRDLWEPKLDFCRF